MPKVALAMIVRNAASELPRCLQSAASLVDEIVVADTGSTDDTPALARSFGARVVDVEWQQDFARARNAGLAHVHSDWVLVLDADERVDVPDLAAWRAQLSSPADAYQVTIRNYIRTGKERIWDRRPQPNDLRWPEANPWPAFIAHENVRLFRRDPELYFVGCVHESVGPRVLSTGRTLGHLSSGLGVIHHFGLTAESEATAAKNHLYRELGRRKIAEDPNNHQAHFELGVMEFDIFGNNAEALRCFERACRLKPNFALAWFFAGASLDRLGHPEQALEFYRQARNEGYASPLLVELEGDAQYRLGRFPEAAASYRQAQRLSPTDGGLPSKRGLAQVRSGRRGPGLSKLRNAVTDAPGLSDNHDRLVAACVWLMDWPGALQALENRIAQLPNDAESYLRMAAVQRQVEQIQAAAGTLNAGLQRLPTDERLRKALLEIESLKSQTAPADTACEWKLPGVAEPEWPRRQPAG